MTGPRIVAIVIAVLMSGANGFGDDISPSEILEKVAATYKTMETYKAEGTITTDSDTGGIKMKMEISFSILLKKPNLYLISWTQKVPPMTIVLLSGAVWNDGTQPCLHTGILKKYTYSKMASDETALGGAKTMSHGAASHFPHISM